MMDHADAKLILYEYLQDELSPTQRSEVETHLIQCKECTAELQTLREIIALLPRPANKASEELSTEYWHQLASRIEEKLVDQKRSRPNPLTDVAQWIEVLLFLRPKYAYVIGGAVAVLIVAFAFRTFLPSESNDVLSILKKKSTPLEHVSSQNPSSGESEFALRNERVSKYFRKSKTLLVGLANLHIDQDEPLDFATERRVSRDLIQEARYLKQQPIDPRSRELMNNLEKILIELGNIEEKNDLPNVEIVRGGIHQENLLFKIRMAEAMYDSSRFLNTRDTQ